MNLSMGNNGSPKNQAGMEKLFHLLKKMAYQIKKFKYFIVFGVVVLSVMWWQGIGVIMRSNFSTKSLLKIEITDNLNQRSRFQEQRANSLTGILTTRKFLKKVVDSLKLQFDIRDKKFFRQEVFLNIDYKDKGQYGIYEFVFKKGLLSIFHTDQSKGIEKKPLINNEKIDLYKPINFNGIWIKFNPEFVEKNKEFEIEARFSSVEGQIGRIKAGLSPRLVSRREFLELGYSDKDRYLARDIANVLTDLFIKENVELKTFKTKQIIKNLNEQLIAAEEKLKQAENNLQEFRRRNPTIILQGTAAGQITNLNSLQANLMTHTQRMKALKQSLQKMTTAQDIDSKLINAQEILVLAESFGYTTASVLMNKLTSENENYRNLLSQYSSTSPFVLDAQDQLNKIFSECRLFAEDLISDLGSKASLEQSEIRKIESGLKRLPAAELKLAALVRERDIAEHTYTSVKQRYNDARVTEKAASPDVFLIDEALLPRMPGPMQTLMIKIIGVIFILVGFPIVVGYVAVLFDNTILIKEELEEKSSLEILGEIPVIGDMKRVPDPDELMQHRKIDKKLVTLNYTPNPTNESFRYIRANIINKLGDLNSRNVLMSVSYLPGEGKSLVTANLAVTFAQNKIPTLLIDGDLRRGVLHNTFVCKKTPGLSELLISKAEPNENIVAELVQQTQVPNLYLLSSGQQVPNPSELLGSDRMFELLTLIKSMFGMVFIDTAPVGLTSDPLRLYAHVDAAMIIAMARKTRLNNVNEMVHQFRKMDKNKLIGIVFNGADISSKNKYKHSYSYYRY